MKPALRLVAFGLALSLLLAACASQLKTPDTWGGRNGLATDGPLAGQ